LTLKVQVLNRENISATDHVTAVKPLPDKVHATKIAEPTNKQKQLQGFIGIVNYYRDMDQKISCTQFFSSTDFQDGGLGMASKKRKMVIKVKITE
jgi:hypothetical protein